MIHSLNVHVLRRASGSLRIRHGQIATCPGQRCLGFRLRTLRARDIVLTPGPRIGNDQIVHGVGSHCVASRGRPARALTIRSRLLGIHPIVRFSASRSSRVRKSFRALQISGGSGHAHRRSRFAKAFGHRAKT